MSLEHARAYERRERVSGLQAVPRNGAVDVRCTRITERERAIRHANARVVIERHRGDDRVIEAKRGEMLPLREQRSRAPLHVPEADHAERA